MIRTLQATPDFDAEVETVEAIVDALEWTIDSTLTDGRITDYLES